VPRAKQRTGQLREHIVQVAVAMLAADGVERFTTRKVAEQAQTSPPAVYELFGDKAGLVREVSSRASGLSGTVSAGCGSRMIRAEPRIGS
jgi:AcrR family transcriptional regulator